MLLQLSLGWKIKTILCVCTCAFSEWLGFSLVGIFSFSWFRSSFSFCSWAISDSCSPSSNAHSTSICEGKSDKIKENTSQKWKLTCISFMVSGIYIFLCCAFSFRMFALCFLVFLVYLFVFGSCAIAAVGSSLPVSALKFSTSWFESHPSLSPALVPSPPISSPVSLGRH